MYIQGDRAQWSGSYPTAGEVREPEGGRRRIRISGSSQGNKNDACNFGTGKITNTVWSRIQLQHYLQYFWESPGAESSAGQAFVELPVIVDCEQVPRRHRSTAAPAQTRQGYRGGGRWRPAGDWGNSGDFDLRLPGGRVIARVMSGRGGERGRAITKTTTQPPLLPLYRTSSTPSTPGLRSKTPPPPATAPPCPPPPQSSLRRKCAGSSCASTPGKQPAQMVFQAECSGHARQS